MGLRILNQRTSTYPGTHSAGMNGILLSCLGVKAAMVLSKLKKHWTHQLKEEKEQLTARVCHGSCQDVRHHQGNNLHKLGYQYLGSAISKGSGWLRPFGARTPWAVTDGLISGHVG